MSPGFDYRDCELGKGDELARMYPQHRKIIERYTK
jgi:predicted cupin superfamily sugar epimerase